MLGNNKGQAILLVVAAMSLALLGGLGLAIDGSQYYSQRTMAQAAADAAAEAGIMSIFNGTNTGANTYGSTSFNCTLTDVRTPCAYARMNGFGGTTDDVVRVEFNPTVTAAGVSLSGSDPTNLIRVTITRTFPTSFMRLLGTNTATIKAAGTAGIVTQTSAIPIIVTHPSMSGALSQGGTSSITICGGPNRAIHVNSTSSTAVNVRAVDLSHAGPDDPGNCSTGTGADFGNRGGPTATPGGISFGTRGKYVQPAAVISDPLASVNPPARPGNTGTMGTATSLADGTNGCPASPKKPCRLYHPGLWTGKFEIKNETAVFAPGVYYMENAPVSNAANGDMLMSTGLTSDPDTGQGVMFYLTGTSDINIGSNSDAILVGSSAAGPFKGILVFEDRAAAAHSHSFGGGGVLNLTGTLYLPAANQSMDLGGGSGSGTVTGEIIVGSITMSGNSSITMNLSNNLTLVRELALIK